VPRPQALNPTAQLAASGHAGGVPAGAAHPSCYHRLLGSILGLAFLAQARLLGPAPAGGGDGDDGGGPPAVQGGTVWDAAWLLCYLAAAATAAANTGIAWVLTSGMHSEPETRRQQAPVPTLTFIPFPYESEARSFRAFSLFNCSYI
jgi:hypothetical protein